MSHFQVQFELLVPQPRCIYLIIHSVARTLGNFLFQEKSILIVCNFNEANQIPGTESCVPREAPSTQRVPALQLTLGQEQTHSFPQVSPFKLLSPEHVPLKMAFSVCLCPFRKNSSFVCPLASSVTVATGVHIIYRDLLESLQMLEIKAMQINLEAHEDFKTHRLQEAS